MKNAFNYLKAFPLANATTNSTSEVLEQINHYSDESLTDSTDALDQVTNVTQLSDVRPTD
jgi:hypothetical protein